MANKIDYGRIVYYEPNEIFGGDNIAVSQEDLNKYVNLSVKVPSRYYNPETFKNYDTVLRGTQFNMKNNVNDDFATFYLTDNYVNVSYNEIRANGEFSAGELFGIDSIDISFDVQFFPQVTINFTDVKGFGLMSTMEHNYEEGKINDLTAKSFFTSLFNFPYPIFTLEVKGYYGKSVSFDLSLLEFHTAFDSQTGNFKTTVKFIGHMYGVYADIPMSYLMVSPYIDYRGELDATSMNNTDPVGSIWQSLGSKNSSPTYLYLMRGFNSLLLNINGVNGGGNFSIINRYVNNNDKKNTLSNILTELEKIIELCEGSKEGHEEVLSQLIYGEDDLLFIVSKDSISQCNLNDRLNAYKTLTNLTKNEFQVYNPRVEEITSVDNYCIWYFPDIRTKIYECQMEINRVDSSLNGNKDEVNEALLSAITTTMGITPNIKNVYGMLFKHLNCFSRHFYKTIENIDRNRKLSDVGLLNYVTDVPLNNSQMENDNFVPPFPAVYDTQNNERVVKYPGEITKFKNQPEIQLTENIFNSINFFGHRAINELTELEYTRNLISETIVTTNGSFVIDGLEELNGITLNQDLKHYNIIRPTNISYQSYNFANEESDNNRYNVDDGKINPGARNAKRSETIRDIFLARLATFGKLHYMKGADYQHHNGEYIAAMEAKLLYESYSGISRNERILNSLKDMINGDQRTFTINRYHVLSGGTTTADELWGFINYKPDDEKKIYLDSGAYFTELIENGHIHSNGYSGDTFIIYGSGLTYDDAYEIFNGINFNNNYKIHSDAKFIDGGEKFNVYAAFGDISRGSQLFGNERENDGHILTRTGGVYDDGDGINNLEDWNWGRKHAITIGDEATRKLLTEEYQYFYCNSSNSLHACAIGGILDGRIRVADWDEELITSNVKEKNNIALINACAMIALCHLKTDRYTWSSENPVTYTGYTAIPITTYKTSPFEEEHVNKFAAMFQITEKALDFYKEVNERITEISEDVLNQEYYVLAKNIQYDRTDDEHKLIDDDVWEIWKKFVCNVLEMCGKPCNATAEQIQRELDKREADKRIKSNIYYTLKALYDKWFSGLNRKYFEIDNEDGEYKKIHYLTTTFNDISNSMIVDLESLVNQVGNAVISTDGSANSVIRFMAKTAEDNNSTFLTLPMKLNWGINDSEIQEIFKPVSFYNGTATHDSLGVSYIVMYNGDVSHHLANERSEFVNDGYDIANYFGGEITASPDAIRLFANEVDKENQYKVPAFGVTYGMQNQNFFKNISVDTTNPSITDYSIANTLTISQQGSLAGVNNSVPSIKSLYPIYANRSYTCSVEMMGCMYITPLMYFQLNNVPMFRGAYIITNVHHRITPNDFSTTFSGVRVSKYKIPINTDVISVTSLLRTRGVPQNNNGSSNSSSSSFANDADLQIVLNREVFYNGTTVGRLYINGEFQCFTMEPTVRKKNNGQFSCNHKGGDNAICPGTYNIVYDRSWWGENNNTSKYKIYKAAESTKEVVVSGITKYHIYTPELHGAQGRAGILIHMGNSGRDKWSDGCIIVGYPDINRPDGSEDLVKNSNEILEKCYYFGRTKYDNYVQNPEEWASFRAYKRVNGAIKAAIEQKKSVKITINQNLSDEEITQIPSLGNGSKIIKFMTPPSYISSNNNVSLGVCQEKYNSLTAVTDWDNFMVRKNMNKINHSLIKVDLKYSTEDNFADVNMYGTLTNAYVSNAMKSIIDNMLGKINKHNTDNSSEGKTKLIIYDAARPVLVQDFMYCLKSNGIGNKKYPAIGAPATGNSKTGGFHQYGSAIDISILGPDGFPLFMGSYFDEALDTNKVAGHMGLENIINNININNLNNAFKFEYKKIGNDSPKLTRKGVKNNNTHTYEYIYSNYYVSNITSESNNINTFLNNYITDRNKNKIKNKCNFLNNTQVEGVLRNRALLILLARTAGLNIEKTEWWHYQETSRTGNKLL